MDLGDQFRALVRCLEHAGDGFQPPWRADFGLRYSGIWIEWSDGWFGALTLFFYGLE